MEKENKEQTVKCPICNKPYKIYGDRSSDQSACPTCRSEANENMAKASQKQGMYKIG